MSTTWKQVVLDVADAVREANGSTAKIPVGQLADKVRAGAGIPYEGENPLTIGSDGYTFPAKTLLRDGLQIVNGVNGEDLTGTAAEQILAVENLLKMVNRKVADYKGEGEYVWKKLTAEGGEFVDFVVSSDAEAHPNGGMQDGYWYELVKEGIDFSNTAVKKIAVDKFTMATDTAGSSGIKINHSLGELPRAAVIIGPITKCATTNTRYFNVHTCVMINLSNKHGAQVSIGYNYQNTENRVALVGDSAWSNPSETQVQYYDGSSYTILPAGIEFTLITMA